MNILLVVSTPVDFFPMAILFVVALGFVVTTMFATHLLDKEKIKNKIRNI